MARLGGYFLDKTPASTVGVCRWCGARYAALSTAGARTMVRAHVASQHGSQLA